jgi:hypothetical protein
VTPAVHDVTEVGALNESVIVSAEFGYVHTRFDTAAFAPNRVGTSGNVGRHSMRGPGSAPTDLGLVKNTTIAERTRVQLRADAFNVMNRFNLAGSSATQSAATFGTITNANVPRVVQFALEFISDLEMTRIASAAPARKRCPC